MKKQDLEKEVENVFNKLENKYKITLEIRQYTVWKYKMKITKEQIKFEKQISDLLDKLNDKYPTSYINRLKYHNDYFGAGWDHYVKRIVLDKPVTLYTFPFDGRILANARKTENIIEISPKLFISKPIYGSGYKREQKYFEKHISTL